MEADPRRREERPVTAARLQTETYDAVKYSPQAAGQRKRAERLLEDASKVADLGDFRRARLLRHEARRLAALARGAA